MASFRGLNDKTIMIIILTTVGISLVFVKYFWIGWELQQSKHIPASGFDIIAKMWLCASHSVQTVRAIISIFVLVIVFLAITVFMDVYQKRIYQLY